LITHPRSVVRCELRRFQVVAGAARRPPIGQIPESRPGFQTPTARNRPAMLRSAAAGRSVKMGHWEGPRRRGLSIRAVSRSAQTPRRPQLVPQLGPFLFLGLDGLRAGNDSRRR
jgi:hypothetical protein